MTPTPERAESLRYEGALTQASRDHSASLSGLRETIRLEGEMKGEAVASGALLSELRFSCILV